MDIGHIVGGHYVGSTHVKDQTLKKTRTLLFPEEFSSHVYPFCEVARWWFCGISTSLHFSYFLVYFHLSSPCVVRVAVGILMFPLNFHWKPPVFGSFLLECPKFLGFSYSQRRQNYLNNYFVPKSVKNYLNNSENHLWSVNRMSVILHFYILKDTRSQDYLK